LENTLDLIFTNVLNLICDLGVQCPISNIDHNLVKFSINLCTADNDTHISDFEWYYDFSGADYESMCHYLGNINWLSEFSFVFSVEDYWNVFVYYLNTAIEAYS